MDTPRSQNPTRKTPPNKNPSTKSRKTQNPLLKPPQDNLVQANSEIIKRKNIIVNILFSNDYV